MQIIINKGKIYKIPGRGILYATEVSERRQTSSSWQTKEVAFEGWGPGIGNRLDERVEAAVGHMFAWRGEELRAFGKLAVRPLEGDAGLRGLD